MVGGSKTETFSLKSGVLELHSIKGPEAEEYGVTGPIRHVLRIFETLIGDRSDLSGPFFVVFFDHFEQRDKHASLSLQY
jgi:hypothetical protein